jgi:hypothetical protein
MELSMPKIKHMDKFVTIPTGPYAGRYQLKVTYQQVAPPEPHEVMKCPCCAEPMVCVFDVVQMGMWEDRFQDYFGCLLCNIAVLFDSTLSRIEIPK